MPGEGLGTGAVTLRELYQQTDAVRVALEAKLDTVTAKLDAALAHHALEHDAHDARHLAEHEKRVAAIRWAVTTVLAIGAIAVSAIALIIKSGG